MVKKSWSSLCFNNKYVELVYTTPYSGSGAASECRPGSYQPEKAKGACLPCPAGQYCQSAGVSYVEHIVIFS